MVHVVHLLASVTVGGLIIPHFSRSAQISLVEYGGILLGRRTVTDVGGRRGGTTGRRQEGAISDLDVVTQVIE